MKYHTYINIDVVLFFFFINWMAFYTGSGLGSHVSNWRLVDFVIELLPNTLLVWSTIFWYETCALVVLDLIFLVYNFKTWQLHVTNMDIKMPWKPSITWYVIQIASDFINFDIVLIIKDAARTIVIWNKKSVIESHHKYNGNKLNIKLCYEIKIY